MLTAKFLGVIPVFSLLYCHNLQVPSSNPGDVTHLSEELPTVLFSIPLSGISLTEVSLRFHANT